VAAALFPFLLLVSATNAFAAGTQNLFASSVGGFRANTEWRTSTIGGGAVYRRTLLHAYVVSGEYLLLGSTGVGVGSADIMVWNPGLVTGTTGLESVPATPSYSCAAQRLASGIAAQGRITSRAMEVAGPDTVPAGGVAGGYTPCWYHAPATGVYSIAMVGPTGFNGNLDPTVAADIGLTAATDFDATQNASVAGWDVTVRGDITNAATTHPGRVFTYLLALNAGANGHPVNITTYPVTPDGYLYKLDDRGLDPAGWVQYGTHLGFLQPDGTTPLYHDALAANTGAPQQLTSIQGGVQFAKPDYAFFFETPSSTALAALGIPLSFAPPTVGSLSFVGSKPGRTTLGKGGTFTYTANVTGVYSIVISRDGVNFDPTAQQNRLLSGLRPAGVQHVTWDGKDNAGHFFATGVGYAYRIAVHGGEYHLPFIDAENDTNGGPTIELLNPPNGVCPPLNGGCFGAFYDDRGYTTTSGLTVGTPGSVLCGLKPPTVAFSDPLNGFDTRTTQRAFGAANGGNANVPCNGNFGDTKGLDLWTYYPSTPTVGQFAVISAELTVPDVGDGPARAAFIAGSMLITVGLALIAAVPRRRAATRRSRPA
jgi:hypothetical protein